MTHPFIEFLQKKYYIDDQDNAFEMFCESNTNQILAMIEDYKQSGVEVTKVKPPTMNPQKPPSKYDKNNPRPVA